MRVTKQKIADEPGAAWRGSSAVALGIGLALALSTAWAVTGPFRSHIFWMYFQQDDFFYYLKIAQNFAAGHGSTFNGIVSTNGYHPLWMLLLSAVMRTGAGPHGVMVFLAISIWVSTMATYLLVLRFLKPTGIGPIANSACAAFVAVYCAHLFVECMEVTLAVPWMLATMVMVQSMGWWSAEGRAGWIRGTLLGLTLSMMVLSRLDTLLFAALLAVGIAGQPTLRSKIRLVQTAGILTGLLPLFGYFLTNRIAFGLWLPVSGMAKDLRIDRGFTAKSWNTLLELSHTQQLNILIVALFLLLLPWLWNLLPTIERPIASAALVFPFLYLGLLSWLSDWRLWGWYFYSFRPALCIVILLLLRTHALRRIVAWPPALAMLVLVTLLRIATVTWDQQTLPSMILASLDLQSFAATHPGIYAMGDRAGAVGYLLPQPLIQTEGLVMNRAFLQSIASQKPLREALAPYGVRYYIGTAMEPYQGCFNAVEPWQAGPHSPHMRERFCQEPVAHWTHQGVETLVYDLSAPR